VSKRHSPHRHIVLQLSYAIAVFESFEEGKGRWVTSKHKDFTGVWELDTSDLVAPSNTRLAMSSAGQRHAIFHTLSSLLQIGSEDFVFQYEVNAANGFGCDGAYVKLLQKTELNEEAFHAGSPYTIMFGPDKCGSTNKVHFIFQHKNPITGVFEEKHLRDAPAVKLDKRTHLYTLIVRPDNSFEILIDGESAKKGSLLEDFEPPVNPPKEIDDPTDSKPSTWVDDAEIDDVNDKKPEDWDESQPAQVEDADAAMPSGWLLDEPAKISDPSASKPNDWSDEDDGDWAAPIIDNPKCSEVGCGVWKRPMKRNPLFKGKFRPKTVPNPEYKGPWKARQIPNPNFFEDKQPSKMQSIGGIGIELLSNSGGISFDNLFIGHSAGAAAAAANFAANGHEGSLPFTQRLTKEEDAIPTDPEPGSLGYMDFLKQNSVVVIAGALLLFVILFAVCNRRSTKPAAVPAPVAAAGGGDAAASAATASEGQASAGAPAESAETTASESAGLSQRKGASDDAAGGQTKSPKKKTSGASKKDN
jgi:calnexin